jgi:hypothetical protein
LSRPVDLVLAGVRKDVAERLRQVGRRVLGELAEGLDEDVRIARLARHRQEFVQPGGWH